MLIEEMNLNKINKYEWKRWEDRCGWRRWKWVENMRMNKGDQCEKNYKYK